jgi:hypothetical protein
MDANSVKHNIAEGQFEITFPISAITCDYGDSPVSFVVKDSVFLLSTPFSAILAFLGLFSDLRSSA